MALAIILIVVLAFTAQITNGVVFNRRSLPEQWRAAVENLNSKLTLKLRIALHPKDGAKLEQTLLEVSTPGKAQFHRYLKDEQITEIVGRSDAEINSVQEWLTSQGIGKIESINVHRDWIFVSATVEQIEKAFSCKLVTFKHAQTGAERIGAQGSYTVPDEISKIVNFVSGMHTFTPNRWTASKGSEISLAAAALVTPQTIYDNYQVPTAGSHGSKLGGQAVVEFSATQNFNEADLQTFFTKYTPSLKGELCGDQLGNNKGTVKGGVEANLDVQYIMAAGVYVNTTDYKWVASNGIEDQFLDWTNYVLAQTNPPLVHSISYGEYGGSYDNVTDQQFNVQLQKLGLKGVSVLLASGDNGVGCNTAGTSQEFDFPSAPFITMVGATYIDATTKKEVGATLSSGGFSLDFNLADWQASAVNAYLASATYKNNKPHESFYPGGRAYPDFSAYGQSVQVVAGGTAESVSGTSCSAPIVSGIISQINHELLSRGKPPLGFLNPWLYANPDMFLDITSGSNPYNKCAGFVAGPGWDPVTGTY